MDLFQIVIPFAVALAVSALASPLVARFALAMGVVDRPTERAVSHRANMPLMGGVSVALGCAAGLLTGFQLTPELDADHLRGFLIGGFALLALGIYDDRFGLGAWWKLAIQIPAAGIAFAYGFRVDYITGPLLPPGPIDLPLWLQIVATTLWIVGVTNAINLMDGLDGLATGLGAIIGTTLAIICFQAGTVSGVILGAILVGALLGFLPFNFSPARIFLGDTGSLFIGFSLALLALENYRKTSLLTFVVPLLALAVPLLDTALSVIRRIRAGQPIFRADRMHMHHRLLQSEGSQRAAVLSLYFLTACFCIIAVSFTRLEGYAALALLVAVVFLTIRLLKNLGVFSLETEAGDYSGAPRGLKGDQE